MADRTYTSQHTSVEQVATALSDAYGFNFEERESDFLGGLYYLARRAAPLATALKVAKNNAFYDGSPSFHTVPLHATVVIAEGVLDQQATDSFMQGLKFTVADAT